MGNIQQCIKLVHVSSRFTPYPGHAGDEGMLGTSLTHCLISNQYIISLFIYIFKKPRTECETKIGRKSEDRTFPLAIHCSTEFRGIKVCVALTNKAFLNSTNVYRDHRNCCRVKVRPCKCCPIHLTQTWGGVGWQDGITATQHLLNSTSASTLLSNEIQTGAKKIHGKIKQSK